MKKNLLGKMVITGIISAAMLASTAASTWAADKSDKDVLRVGMECAYAPFNWTQDTDTTPDGSKAEPIYGSDYYAYGYDVAVAQKLADQLGMKLEIHKVEWSSIGISMDAGDYDCIIAGMGKTAEREKSYAFTEPYYYRDNCIVVKAGGKYDDVKGLSDLAGTGCKVTTPVSTALSRESCCDLLKRCISSINRIGETVLKKRLPFAFSITSRTSFTPELIALNV